VYSLSVFLCFYAFMSLLLCLVCCFMGLAAWIKRYEWMNEFIQLIYNPISYHQSGIYFVLLASPSSLFSGKNRLWTLCFLLCCSIMLLHKSGTIIIPAAIRVSPSLDSFNVTSKLTTLPRRNSHHLATTPHLWIWFILFNSGALPILIFTLHYMSQCAVYT